MTDGQKHVTSDIGGERWKHLEIISEQAENICTITTEVML